MYPSATNVFCISVFTINTKFDTGNLSFHFIFHHCIIKYIVKLSMRMYRYYPSPLNGLHLWWCSPFQCSCSIHTKEKKILLILSNNIRLNRIECKLCHTTTLLHIIMIGLKWNEMMEGREERRKMKKCNAILDTCIIVVTLGSFGHYWIFKSILLEYSFLFLCKQVCTPIHINVPLALDCRHLRLRKATVTFFFFYYILLWCL